MQIKTKLAVLIWAFTAVIIIILSFLFYGAEKKLLLDELSRHHSHITKNYAEICREYLISSNDIMILNYIKKLVSSDEIDFAMLTDTKGSILTHSDLNMIGRKTEWDTRNIRKVQNRPLYLDYTDSRGNKAYTLAQPVYVNDILAGITWLGLSGESMKKITGRTLSGSRRRIIFIALLGLFLSMAGSLLLSHIIASRLHTGNRQAHRKTDNT